MCGFGVQEEKIKKNVDAKIHTIGCINRLQQYFESNLFTVGIVALCVAVTQLGGKISLLFSFIHLLISTLSPRLCGIVCMIFEVKHHMTLQNFYT